MNLTHCYTTVPENLLDQVAVARAVAGIPVGRTLSQAERAAVAQAVLDAGGSPNQAAVTAGIHESRHNRERLRKSARQRCRHNHLLTDANTYRDVNGYRLCRTCRDNRRVEHKRRKGAS